MQKIQEPKPAEHGACLKAAPFNLDEVRQQLHALQVGEKYKVGVSKTSTEKTLSPEETEKTLSPEEIRDAALKATRNLKIA